MIKWCASIIVLMLLIVFVFWTYKKGETNKNIILADSAKAIVLYLNQISKDKEIYSTRLLNIDIACKEITLEIQLPNEGWKMFKGKEGERLEGGYYFINEVHEDHVVIIVGL